MLLSPPQGLGGYSWKVGYEGTEVQVEVGPVWSEFRAVTEDMCL